MSRYDLAIVGCSLEGVAMALQAAEQGKSVIVFDEGPGMTSFWPGFFEVFGPTSLPMPAQTRLRLAQGDSPRAASVTLDAQRRLDQLAGRDPAHPHGALDFEAPRVREAFAAWTDLLEIPGEFHREPKLVPTLLGSVRRVDFSAQGQGWFDGTPLTLVGLDAWPQWSPEWAAQALEAATGVRPSVAWCRWDGPPVESTLSLAAHVERETDAWVESLVQAATGPILLPPILGTSFESRQRIGARLADEGIQAGEIAGGVESAFGLRLHKHLREVLARRVTVAKAPEQAPARDGSRWVVSLDEGTIQATELVAAFDGVSPPAWAEAWLETAIRWPNNTSTSPWEVQRYERLVGGGI